MNEIVKITLPMPPSVNAAYRNGQHGRFKSRRYREWEELCKTYKNEKVKFIYEGEKVTASYIFYSKWLTKDCRNPLRKDLSNYLKCLEDYIPNIIEDFDDRYIWEYANIKKQHSNREEVEISLEFKK